VFRCPLDTVTRPSNHEPSPSLSRRYVLISPCRNESEHMRQTLDTVVAQTVRPARWVIVDDGSTDDTPAILAEYAAEHDWIDVVTRKDRGHRAEGKGFDPRFCRCAQQVTNPAHAEAAGSNRGWGLSAHRKCRIPSARTDPDLTAFPATPFPRPRPHRVPRDSISYLIRSRRRQPNGNRRASPRGGARVGGCVGSPRCDR
jgi:glycosyltransferase involved in cell wall biosynthesis